MLLNGMSLDCETDMAFILPVRFHLKKISVHKCNFADPDSHMHGKGILTLDPSMILRNETIRHGFNKKKMMRKVWEAAYT